MTDELPTVPPVSAVPPVPPRVERDALGWRILFAISGTREGLPLPHYGYGGGYAASAEPSGAPGEDATGSSGRTFAGLVIGAAILWQLVTGVLVVAGLAAFLWGGTNDAHLRCLAHRLGEPSFLGSVACEVEH